MWYVSARACMLTHVDDPPSVACLASVLRVRVLFMLVCWQLMDIAPMADGTHLAVAGYFRGELKTVNNQVINNANANSADRNGFVAKWDSVSGEVKWIKAISSYRSTDQYGIASDSAGNVYTAGKFCVPCPEGESCPPETSYGRPTGRLAPVCHGTVRKFNAEDGSLVWHQDHSNVGAYWGIKVGSDATVYVTGGLKGSTILKGTKLSPIAEPRGS